MVIASSSLQSVTMEMEREYRDIGDLSYRLDRQCDEVYMLSTKMKDFTIIFAPTYAEAFSFLFNTWKPEEVAPRKAIEGRQQ